MNPSRAASLRARDAVLALAVGLALAGPAAGKTGDAEQPIRITAAHQDMDDQSGAVLYSGKVEITQGSLKLTGERVTVYRRASGELDRLVAEGKPAVYRQLTDRDEPVEGRALRIEYSDETGLVVFLHEVKLVQEGGDTMAAERVEYHSGKNTVQSSGGKNGLVETVIQPRKKKVEAPSTDAPKP